MYIDGRNSPYFRATRRVHFRNFTRYLDLIKKTCLVNLFENNYLIIKNFYITICFTLNNHHQHRMVVGFKFFFFLNKLTFFSARWRLDVMDRPKRWSTIVDLVKLKRTWKGQPYTGGWILNVKGISKPLENMNLKFIYDIKM